MSDEPSYPSDQPPDQFVRFLCFHIADAMSSQQEQGNIEIAWCFGGDEPLTNQADAPKRVSRSTGGGRVKTKPVQETKKDVRSFLL